MELTRIDSQDQFVMELRKAILESGIKKKDIAHNLKVSPQYITKMLTKKNFSVGDTLKILDEIGYEMNIEFKNKGK